MLAGERWRDLGREDDFGESESEVSNEWHKWRALALIYKGSRILPEWKLCRLKTFFTRVYVVYISVK